jgi:hypothetical protein
MRLLGRMAITISAVANGRNDLKLPNGESFHVSYWDDGTMVGAMRLAGGEKKSESRILPPTSWPHLRQHGRPRATRRLGRVGPRRSCRSRTAPSVVRQPKSVP